MKKLILGALGLGAGWLAGCQPQASPPATVTAAAPAVAPAPTPPSAPARAGRPLPLFFAPADTLTPAMRELLRTQDLSPLWQSLGHWQDGLNTFEGFFGPEHYHFALVLTRVERDATNPAVYHVAGKSRYFPSRNVRPFAGTLTVRQVADLSYPGFLASLARNSERASDSLQGRTYSARAQLQWREAQAENGGVFEGEALLDFYVVPKQPPGFVHVFAFEGTDDRLPTRGGGVLLRGNRRNETTGQLKPFLVSPDVAAAAPFVLKDFMLDERMGQINPKYTKLGWNEYWRNDEWWADAPKPSLSL